jgi:hypothetical protein
MEFTEHDTVSRHRGGTNLKVLRPGGPAFTFYLSDDHFLELH